MIFTVTQARSRLANAVRNGDPGRVQAAREAFHLSKLAAAIGEHGSHLSRPLRIRAEHLVEDLDRLSEGEVL